MIYLSRQKKKHKVSHEDSHEDLKTQQESMIRLLTSAFPDNNEHPYEDLFYVMISKQL